MSTIWAGSGTPSFPAMLSDPYHQDALGLTLPLSAGHTYEVVAATVNLVGAAGTWDAGNHWVLSLESRSAALGVDTVLATATFDTGGQATVVLTPASPVTVDADTTPVLAIAFQRVGNPGLLLRANATTAFAGAGEAGITSISYDQYGKTVSEAGPAGITTYTWNAEDRLVAVETAEGTEQYTYDARGLRRRKVTGAGTTEFVWDGQNLLAELDGELETQAQQTDFPGWWGGLASRREGSESSFFTYDMSSNARSQIDEAASVEVFHDFTAFGVVLANAVACVGFGGQVGYQAPGNAWLYVRRRYYSAATARWLSRDPIGIEGDQHLYRYVRNDPVAYLDPSGLLITTCEYLQTEAPLLPRCDATGGSCAVIRRNCPMLKRAFGIYKAVIRQLGLDGLNYAKHAFEYWLYHGRGTKPVLPMATLVTEKRFTEQQKDLREYLIKRMKFAPDCEPGAEPAYDPNPKTGVTTPYLRCETGYGSDSLDLYAGLGKIAVSERHTCKAVGNDGRAPCRRTRIYSKDWNWDVGEKSVPFVGSCSVDVFDQWAYELTISSLHNSCLGLNPSSAPAFYKIEPDLAIFDFKQRCKTKSRGKAQDCPKQSEPRLPSLYRQAKGR